MSPGEKSDLYHDLQYVEINLNNVKSLLPYDSYQLAMVVEQLADIVKKIVEQV